MCGHKNITMESYTCVGIQISLWNHKSLYFFNSLGHCFKSNKQQNDKANMKKKSKIVLTYLPQIKLAPFPIYVLTLFNHFNLSVYSKKQVE